MSFCHLLSIVRAGSAEELLLYVPLDGRPLNAFNTDLWQELGQLVDEASENPDVRVIILASNLDAAFSAGLDLKSSPSALTSTLEPARKAVAIQSYLRSFQHAVSSLERCIKPVIVALHGLCLGLAIDIAAAADIRFASSTTTFAIAEVAVGLAADIGTLQRFPRKVPAVASFTFR